MRLKKTKKTVKTIYGNHLMRERLFNESVRNVKSCRSVKFSFFSWKEKAQTT